MAAGFVMIEIIRKFDVSEKLEEPLTSSLTGLVGYEDKLALLSISEFVIF
jgi:hypothetical protein